MSGYFVGYFIGARTIPNLVSGVGHIRVFAFASIASLICFSALCFYNQSFFLVFLKNSNWF